VRSGSRNPSWIISRCALDGAGCRSSKRHCLAYGTLPFALTAALLCEQCFCIREELLRLRREMTTTSGSVTQVLHSFGSRWGHYGISCLLACPPQTSHHLLELGIAAKYAVLHCFLVCCRLPDQISASTNQRLAGYVAQCQSMATSRHLGRCATLGALHCYLVCKGRLTRAGAVEPCNASAEVTSPEG
jgi:hypothetical protein